MAMQAHPAEPQGWHDNTFFSPNGRVMHYAFVPAKGVPTATIVITTGYDEPINAYRHVAARYQEMGTEVWLMNWHEHGKQGWAASKPHLHSFAAIQNHAEDLNHFVKTVVRPTGENPVFMSTHSIGGYIGLLNLYRFPGVFDGAIMATPFFDHYKFGLPASTRPAFKLAASALCHSGLGDVSLEPVQKAVKGALRLTGKLRRGLAGLWKDAAEPGRNPVEAKIKRMIYKSKMPTIGCVDTLLRSYALMSDPQFLSHIETPMLVATTGQDTIVDNRVTQEFIGRMPEGLARHVHIRNADHRLFGERPPAVDEWWNHIGRFIEDRCKAFRPGVRDPQVQQTEEKIRNVLLAHVLPKPL